MKRTKQFIISTAIFTWSIVTLIFLTGIVFPPTYNLAENTIKCEKTICPSFTYKGGAMILQPKIYIVLWGKAWTDQGKDANLLKKLANAEKTFFVKIDKTSWWKVLQQYKEGSQSIQNIVSVKVLNLASNPKRNIGMNDYSNATKQIIHQYHIHNTPNTIMIFLTQPGVNITSNDNGNQNSKTHNFCAYHSTTPVQSGVFNQVAYIAIPFLEDKYWTNCISNFIPSSQNLNAEQQLIAATMVISSHELAETITDPQYYNLESWTANLFSQKFINAGMYEIADICILQDYVNNDITMPNIEVTQTNNHLYVENIYSNKLFLQHPNHVPCTS